MKIELKKDLNSLERNFFIFLLSKCIQNNHIQLNFEDVKELLINKRLFHETLDTLFNTSITCESDNRKTFFQLISSYSLSKNGDFYLELPKELVNLNFKLFFEFKNPNSYSLFSKLKEYKKGKLLWNYFISVQDLRNIFQKNTSYERVYDFETKLLLPAIKEIGEIGKYHVSYAKIRENKSNRSKVIGLSITFCKPLHLKELEKLLQAGKKYGVSEEIIVEQFQKKSSEEVLDFMENTKVQASNRTVIHENRNSYPSLSVYMTKIVSVLMKEKFDIMLFLRLQNAIKHSQPFNFQIDNIILEGVYSKDESYFKIYKEA